MRASRFLFAKMSYPRNTAFFYPVFQHKDLERKISGEHQELLEAEDKRIPWVISSRGSPLY